MSIELALINLVKKATDMGLDLINKNSNAEKKQKEDLVNYIKSKKDNGLENSSGKTFIEKKSEQIIKEASSNLKEAQDNLKELLKTYSTRDNSYTYALGNKKIKLKPKKRSKK